MRTLSAALLITYGLAISAHAVEVGPTPDDADAISPKENVIQLFDGKSLQGWHKPAKRIGHGTGGHWAVENGVLAGEQDPPGSGVRARRVRVE